MIGCYCLYSTGLFASGADVIHSVINIVCVWLLVKVLGGTGLSVALAFVFNLVSQLLLVIRQCIHSGFDINLYGVSEQWNC